MAGANGLTARASKNRKDPFTLSFNELDHMIDELDLPVYAIQDISGAFLRKGNAFRSDVWLIPAQDLYNFLIQKGHRSVLESSGIVNYETLVAQFGAW